MAELGPLPALFGRMIDKGASVTATTSPDGTLTMKFEPKTKRCTRMNRGNQCRIWFDINDPHKLCPRHRARAKASLNKPEVKAKAKKTRTAWLKTDAGKKWNKRHNRKPMNRLLHLLHRMVKGGHTLSLVRLGCFESNDDVKAHFESTMDKTWMTWENYGVHVAGNGYKCNWNFGHKLPRAIFDQENTNDHSKCFSKLNLFAQDAKENIEMRARVSLTDEELLALRPCWPDAVMNDLKRLKMRIAMFQRGHLTEADDPESNEDKVPGLSD